MARQAPRSDGLLTRIGFVLLGVLIVWLVVSSILGFVFSLIRMLLFLALFAIVAWFVLVGPPDRRD
jgi:Ca2+/Na+ antiporter